MVVPPSFTQVLMESRWKCPQGSGVAQVVLSSIIAFFVKGLSEAQVKIAFHLFIYFFAFQIIHG